MDLIKYLTNTMGIDIVPLSTAVLKREAIQIACRASMNVENEDTPKARP